MHEQTVPVEIVPRFLLLPPERIRQLVTEGVLERAKDKRGQTLRGRFNLVQAVNRYISYLRSKVVGSGAGGESDYVVAKTGARSLLSGRVRLRSCVPRARLLRPRARKPTESALHALGSFMRKYFLSSL